YRPVRKLEAQSPPALRLPAFGDATAFQHEMRATALAEQMAHRQPGLPAADDQRLDTADTNSIGAHPSSPPEFQRLLMTTSRYSLGTPIVSSPERLKSLTRSSRSRRNASCAVASSAANAFSIGP